MMFDACGQRASVGMRWEEGPDDGRDEAVLGLFDDLEMQAEGLHLAERAVEADELSVAQYADVGLGARLHASLGRSIRVGTIDGLELHGTLAQVGSDWLLVEDDAGTAWIAHLPHVALLGGLAAGGSPEEARPLSARLSLRSALRSLAGERRQCVLHLRGGRTLQGTLVRVGADFVDLDQQAGRHPVTVPVAAVAVVQGSS